MKWRLEHETLESSLGYSEVQLLLLLLLLLLGQDSGLVSGDELTVETSSKALNTSLVVIFLQVHSIIFHKISSGA